MAQDYVAAAVKSAKDALAKANKFTESVEGNPTSAFAPKKLVAPHIPQAHEFAKTPYSLAVPAEDAKAALRNSAQRDQMIKEAVPKTE